MNDTQRWTLVGGGLALVLVATATVISCETGKKAKARVVAEPAKAPVAAPVPPPEPAPAPAPVQAPAPKAGIGVTRQTVRVAFEPEGFAFEPGVQQIMGKHKGGTMILQVLGDPDDVRSVGLMGAVTDTLHAGQTMLAALKLVQVAMPQWEGAATWLVHALGKGKDASVQKGAVELDLAFHPELGGLVNVTVRRADGE